MSDLTPRQRFSEAASKYADLEAFALRAREALAAVEAKANAASLELQEAESALREAEQGSNDAQAALRRAMGDGTQPSVTALRHSVDEKRAIYSEVSQERALCRRQIEFFELNDLMRCEHAKREALGALLAASPAVAGLLGDLHAARRHCVTLEAALRVIARTPGALRPYWDSIRSENEIPDLALAERWRDAISRLLLDPDAPLPGGDPEPAPRAAAA